MSSPHDWICRKVTCAPMRCSRTVSHARKISSPPGTLRRAWQLPVLQCCGSISPGSGPPKGSSRTPTFPPMSRTWSAPLIICARTMRLLRSSLATRWEGPRCLRRPTAFRRPRRSLPSARHRTSPTCCTTFMRSSRISNATASPSVTLAGRTFRISKQLVDDARGQALKDRIANLRKALLVMHAPRDQTVGIEHATAIFTAAKHPKSFVSLDTCGPPAVRPAGCRLCRSRHCGLGITLPAGAGRGCSIPIRDSGVVVAETGAGNFRTRLPPAAIACLPTSPHPRAALIVVQAPMTIWQQPSGRAPR